MMALVSQKKTRICICLFYSCRQCGTPLVTVKDGKTIDRREIGICADCELSNHFEPNGYDPYGQPFLAEVTA